jgi:DNA-binding transcriptional LysR family regulator
MNANRFDHNLLPVLRVLLRECSVSNAAHLLGMTQSGASAALRRLRRHFNDPLLVRAGKEMVATPQALRLLERLEDHQLAVGRVLRRDDETMAALERTFTIWTGDAIALRIGSRLLPQLRAEAPHVTLRFLHSDIGQVRTPLLRGTLDIAIGPSQRFNLSTPTLCARALFEEQFVAVVSPSHPLASAGQISQAELRGQGSILFDVGVDSVTQSHRQLLSGCETHGSIVATADQMTLLPLLAMTTGTLAIVTTTAAEELSALLPLVVLPIVDSTTTHKVHMFWSEVHRHDVHHRWLRDALAQALGVS